MTDTQKQFTILPDQDGVRLDKFLVKELGINRSGVMTMIKAGQVSVNDTVYTKGGRILHTDQVVLIGEPTVAEEKKDTIEIKKDDPALLEKIQILAEADDYIVVTKPAGLLVHPTEANEAVTLSGWLLTQYPELEGVGENPVRPGIVHRLDREASGALVIARNQKMFDHLKKQFQARTVRKEYTVLTHGEFEKPNGVLDFPIDRGRDGKMVARPIIQDVTLESVRHVLPGKESKTEYRVTEQFASYTLLNVRIHSGRTHQIRVHMLAFGHPVVGDTLYTTKQVNKKKDAALGRLFLHATTLCFHDLDGNEHCYHAALPSELTDFLPQFHTKKKSRPNIVIISGPSGAGEDSIITELEQRIPLERIVTTTSRDKREGESEKNPYYFISQEEFEQKIAAGEMFEYAKQYNNNYYGVSYEEIERVKASGKLGVWKMEYKGVEAAKQLMPKIAAIYISAPLDILEQRIRSRGGVTEEYIEERMAYTQEWLNHLDIYDYSVENEQGKLSEAVDRVQQIIEKELDIG